MTKNDSPKLYQPKEKYILIIFGIDSKCNIIALRNVI